MNDRRYGLERRTVAAASLWLLFFPALANAHPSLDHLAGFVHGLQHPFGGLDHMAAMLAVGAWAARRGGRALWMLPTAFVASVIIGGMMAASGMSFLISDEAIVLSVLLLGILILKEVRLPLPVGAAVLAAFGLPHGYAHMAEMPADVSSLTYGCGFVLATAVLHGLGAAAVLVAHRLPRCAPPVMVMRGLIAGVMIATLATHVGTARAENYPAKPIHIVVPYPPGGEIDFVARLLGQKFSESLNQPVVVDNRPGAGGNIGANAVAKAAPDGYTLLMTPSNLAIAPSIYRNLPFDVVNDFAPISRIIATSLVLVAAPRTGVSTVSQLVALAKAKPAKLNYGHAGSGTTLHLTMELFKKQTGVDIQAVPYKGTSPISTALLSGEVDLAFMSMDTVLGHIKSGKLRALAVTSRERSPVLPEVPTLVEAGLKDFVGVPGWHGLFAPAGTPREILDMLQRQVMKALASADIRDRAGVRGWELVGSTPKEFEETYKADIAKFAKIAQEASVVLQN